MMSHATEMFTCMDRAHSAWCPGRVLWGPALWFVAVWTPVFACAFSTASGACCRGPCKLERTERPCDDAGTLHNLGGVAGLFTHHNHVNTVAFARFYEPPTQSFLSRVLYPIPVALENVQLQSINLKTTNQRWASYPFHLELLVRPLEDPAASWHSSPPGGKEQTDFRRMPSALHDTLPLL